MLNCVIVDDEPRAISVLEEYVSRTDFLQLEATFRNPVEAVTYLNANNVQLLFLDINMPGLHGMQVPTLLQRPPMIVFTTAYSEYAVESYSLEVVDYLLKPIEFPGFFQAASRAFSQGQHNKSKLPEPTAGGSAHHIYVKSGPKLHRLVVDDILFLEKDGHYVTFNTLNSKVLARMTIQQATEMLPQNRFVQVHKSFIIAIDRITVVESHQVQIMDMKVPIGAAYRDNLKRIIQS